VSRRHVLYLKDMVAACAKVREFSQGLTFESFASYGMAYYSLVRLLEIIGEAAKNVPDSVRVRHPEVEWQRIGRTRDIMAHHYFALENETLWEIIQDHVPQLEAQLGPIVEDESNKVLDGE